MLLVSFCLRLAIIFSAIDSSPRLSRLSISRTLYLLNYHPFVSFIRRMDVARLIVRINSLFFLSFVGFLRWLGSGGDLAPSLGERTNFLMTFFSQKISVFAAKISDDFSLVINQV